MVVVLLHLHIFYIIINNVNVIFNVFERICICTQYCTASRSIYILYRYDCLYLAMSKSSTK